MFITKMALERRSFLRGVGATLALPFLDAMTPAFAAPGKAIPRLSFMYIPNGINIAQWTPSGSGKDFAFSSTLKSLEPFRDQLSCRWRQLRHVVRSKRAQHVVRHGACFLITAQSFQPYLGSDPLKALVGRHP